MPEQGGPQSYRMPTMAWVANAFDSKSIPNHSNLTGLTIRPSTTYTVAGIGGTRLYDGYVVNNIATLRLKRGGTTYFHARGMDLPWLHQVLQKEPHGLTQYAIGAGAGQVVGSPAQLDIEVPIPRDPGGVKAELEITWTGGLIGTDVQVTSGALDGGYNFSDGPVPALRVLMCAGMNNKTGDQNQVEIPVEGQLLALLIIARATASPYAQRDPTGCLLQVRVEGVEKYEIDWRDAKEDFKNYCNLPTVQTGVALLLFKDLPLIRGSSYLYIDSDVTATDFNVYALYTAGATKLRAKESTLDILAATGVGAAPVRGSLSQPGKVSAYRPGEVPLAVR